MRQIKIYGVYFLNVGAILRGGVEGHNVIQNFSCTSPS